MEYFPTPLRERFRGYMDPHPLRREIIATSVVNSMVNDSGITFAFRMGEETGASASDITRAYLVAREVFHMESFWRSVDELDYQIDTATQISMRLEARKLTERGARWLLHNRRMPFDIRDTVDFFAAGAAALCRAHAEAPGRPRPGGRSRSGGTASPSRACRTSSPSRWR